jgi:hypothetical protein
MFNERFPVVNSTALAVNNHSPAGELGRLNLL